MWERRNLNQIHKIQSTIKGKIPATDMQVQQTYFRKAAREEFYCFKETLRKKQDLLTGLFSNRHAAIRQKYSLNWELISVVNSLILFPLLSSKQVRHLKRTNGTIFSPLNLHKSFKWRKIPEDVSASRESSSFALSYICKKAFIPLIL